MRILALVPSYYDTSPGQRFRMEQWEPLLRAQGVEIDFESFECERLHSLLYEPGNFSRKIGLIARAFARRAMSLRSVGDYDAVYVFREAALLGPALFERWIHATGTPMVFDFDDAIFVRYISPSNGYLSYLKFPAKTRAICRMAAHVIAGNDYLADYARKVNPNVTIVPTTIDTEKYTVESHKTKSDIPVIGWSGSYSTVQHLDTLRGALKRLAERERFRLRVIGTASYELEGVEVEAIPWRAETEVADLRPIDIGVMPLPDEDWSRGKCGLKALQYMALGIPTLCSPVGVNSEIIRDGENGLIADTEDEWVEKLSLLLRSAQLREDLRMAGRATVETDYSASVQAPRVYNILKSLTRGAGKSDERITDVPAPSR
ncbi:MAG: glycosyltransferase family 4 protein [Blastocatellia bacterium]|nr:glycosyltransferase family 4 protein [Blastocatellia bacterium]